MSNSHGIPAAPPPPLWGGGIWIGALVVGDTTIQSFIAYNYYTKVGHVNNTLPKAVKNMGM